jgi:carboxymethylenebutenolidase
MDAPAGRHPAAQRLAPRAFALAVAAALVLAPGRAAAQQAAATLPADEAGALERLNRSPRHGEWVRYDAGGGDTVKAWVVYPERRDRAPVVLVISEIFALSDWLRGVADQLAAEGFIAVAPDLITGKGPNGGGTESVDRQGAVRLIMALDRGEVMRRLQAAARYGTSLPAARNAVGAVGFCWGGSTSFALATAWGDLRAAVVYYGTSPADSLLGSVRAPVLGLYGADDARVVTTVAPAQAVMQRLGKRYDVQIFDGAGHGFLRAQTDRNGANQRAAEQAWPRTVAFLRENLGR